MNMNIVTQKTRHPWIILSFMAGVCGSMLFILIGYYNWPPKLSFNWIVGSIVTITYLTCSADFGIRLLYQGKYSFEMNDTEIIIRDWGFLRPRVRIFSASSVIKIYHSSEGSSGLKTKDGKTHYINDVLMLKYREVFEQVKKTYKHISTSSN